MSFTLSTSALTSELDAVNMVLRAKGLDGVTDIDLGDADIAEAVFYLDDADIEVQSKGWWFNKDYNLQLSPDSNSEIPLPAGTLGVGRGYYSNGWIPLTERAGKLYDLYNKTFTFTAPVITDIIVRLDFTDLPVVARRYIATLAAHRAQGVGISNTTVIQITQQMLLQALTRLEWQQDDFVPNNQVHQNLTVMGAVNGFGGLRRTRQI